MRQRPPFKAYSIFVRCLGNRNWDSKNPPQTVPRKTPLSAGRFRKTACAIISCFLEGWVGPTLEAYRQQGLSQRRMVEALNECGVPAPRGGRWHAQTLTRVLKRLG